MPPPQPTSTSIARFIPGLALIKGFSPALLRTELVVAVTVYRGVADKETAMTEPGLKCVILDAEAISDFDSTAAEALENLDADLERLGVELWIARANGPLRELLTSTGLTKRLGSEHIYPSVRAAVAAYRAHVGAS